MEAFKDAGRQCSTLTPALPKPGRALIYLGARMIAGIRLARESRSNVREPRVSAESTDKLDFVKVEVLHSHRDGPNSALQADFYVWNL